MSCAIPRLRVSIRHEDVRADTHTRARGSARFRARRRFISTTAVIIAAIAASPSQPHTEPAAARTTAIHTASIPKPYIIDQAMQTGIMASVYFFHDMRTMPAPALTAVCTPTVRKHSGIMMIPHCSKRRAPERGTGPSNQAAIFPRRPFFPEAASAPLAAARPSQ